MMMMMLLQLIWTCYQDHNQQQLQQQECSLSIAVRARAIVGLTAMTTAAAEVLNRRYVIGFHAAEQAAAPSATTPIEAEVEVSH
jgi:hypothetical protein